MKDGTDNALLGCLAVYRLKEFERLVVKQDEFVELENAPQGLDTESLSDNICPAMP